MNSADGVIGGNRASHDARRKTEATDRRVDELLDEYEDQLAERLALLLAAELRRRLEGQSKE